MFLPSSLKIKLLNIIFQGLIGMQMNIIRAGFISIYSLCHIHCFLLIAKEVKIKIFTRARLVQWLSVDL